MYIMPHSGKERGKKKGELVGFLDHLVGSRG